MQLVQDSEPMKRMKIELILRGWTTGHLAKAMGYSTHVLCEAMTEKDNMARITKIGIEHALQKSFWSDPREFWMREFILLGKLDPDASRLILMDRSDLKPIAKQLRCYNVNATRLTLALLIADRLALQRLKDEGAAGPSHDIGNTRGSGDG